jgi:hypothetical protein
MKAAARVTMVVQHIFELNEETGSKLTYIIYINFIPDLPVHFMEHH